MGPCKFAITYRSVQGELQAFASLTDKEPSPEKHDVMME
jgi:hypothetical protein